MATQPAWAKAYAKSRNTEADVPVQMTIIGMKTMPRTYGMPQSRQPIGANGAPEITLNGNGPDGVLQTDNPVDLTQTDIGPIATHEGEMKIQMPDGSTKVVPAAQAQMAIKQLQDMGLIGGMEFGGSFMTRATDRISGAMNQAATNATSGSAGAMANVAGRNQTIAAAAPTVRMPSVIGDVTNRINEAAGDMRSSLNNNSAPVGATTIAGPMPTITHMGYSGSENNTINPVTKAIDYDAQKAALDAKNAQERTNAITEHHLAPAVPAIPAPPDSTPEAETIAAGPAPMTEYERALNEAFRNLQATAANGSEYDKARANQAIRDYQMGTATAGLAQRQTLAADSTLTPEARRALIAEQARTGRMGEATLQSGLANEAMQRSEEANLNVLNMGNTLAQQEVEAGWKQYNAAMAAGDLAGAAEAYKSVTGKDLDTAQLIKAQNLENYGNVYDAVVNKGMSWYDLTSSGLLNAGEPGSQQYIEAEKTYKALKNIYDNRLTTENTAAATGASNAASQRIGELYMASPDIGAITDDQLLRGYIKTLLGPDATEEAIDAEIMTKYNAYLKNNENTFIRTATDLMNDAFMNGLRLSEEDVTKVVGDSKIREAIAGWLKVDVNSDDPAVQQRITDEITTRWERTAMSPVNLAYDNLISSEAVEQYRDIPGFEADVKKVISDLVRNGAINSETGLPDADAVFDWPWEDPKTYFKYTDWNGNDIDDNKPADPNTQISVSGNGEKFGIRDANGNIRAVTFSDAEAAWNDPTIVTPSERAAYFETGDPVAAFLRGEFTPPLVPGASNTLSGNVDEMMDRYREDSITQDMVDSITADWDSLATVPDEGAVDEEGNPIEGAEEVGIGAGQFQYMTESGELKTVPKDSNAFRCIVIQLNDAFPNSDGSPLNVSQFSALWDDGKGWIVDDDGIIQNLNPAWREEHPEASEKNKYKIDNDKYLANFHYSTTYTPPSSLTDMEAAGVRYDPAQGTVFDVVYDVGPKEYNSGKGTRWMEGNPAVYAFSENGWQATFQPEFRKWVLENKGNTFTYNGVQYRIDGNDPILSNRSLGVTELDDMPDQYFNADMLRVTNLETGEEEKLTFDIQPKRWARRK